MLVLSIKHYQLNVILAFPLFLEDDTTEEKSQVNLFRISTENVFESQFLLIPGGMQIPKQYLHSAEAPKVIEIILTQEIFFKGIFLIL